jgi:hypothetical protein
MSPAGLRHPLRQRSGATYRVHQFVFGLETGLLLASLPGNAWGSSLTPVVVDDGPPEDLTSLQADQCTASVPPPITPAVPSPETMAALPQWSDAKDKAVPCVAEPPPLTHQSAPVRPRPNSLSSQPRPEGSRAIQFSPPGTAADLQPTEPLPLALEPTQPSAPEIETAAPTNPALPPPGSTYDLPAAGLPALVTRFDLDGVTYRHGDGTQIMTGVHGGDGRSTNLEVVGHHGRIQRQQGQVSEGNRITLEHATELWRVGTVPQERRLTLARQDPRRVIGQRLQASLTASCLGLGGEPGQSCSYTPGLVIGLEDIDPNTLLPRRVHQTSAFGEVVSAESLAAMAAPGFQAGAGDQRLGLDLYLPNVGATAGNDLTTQSQVDRHEQFATTPTLSLSQVSQVVQANGEAAALGRTVRGPAVVLDPNQSWVNVVLAAAALALPEIRPAMGATTAIANPNVNQNLFLAANNTRLPTDSLTLYQGGLGYALTPAEAQAERSTAPAANYNSVWLGLSPVTERTYTSDRGFEPLGPLRVLAEGQAEGGTDANGRFLAVVNGQLFDGASLEDAYTQLYLTFFEQDVTDVTWVQQTDRLRYAPHLSFSGNTTQDTEVFRYYLGVIPASTVQAYGGLDYRQTTPDGWAYQLGAIGYINPSYDRYSTLSAALSRQVDLAKDTHLQLGLRGVWALDQDTSRGDLEEVSQGSSVVAQARLRFGNASLGVRQTLGALLPNSQPSRTVVEASMDLGDRVSLSGYWSPFDQATSSPQAGLSTVVRLGDQPTSPALIAAWNNSRYSYGNDLFGRELSTSAHTVSVFLRLGFSP